MPDLRNIAVLSCFGADHPEVVEFLNDLDAALKRRGVALVVLTTIAQRKLTALSLPIPYDFNGFDSQFDDSISRPPFHPFEQARDGAMAWGAAPQSVERTAHGIAKCEAFYRMVATHLKPAIGMFWNTTHPHSRIARNTMSAHGVPAYCIERGWLMGTFQLHSTENNAFNDLHLDFPTRQRLKQDVRSHAEDPWRFNAARDYYITRAKAKYAGKDKLDPQAVRAKYGIDDAPLIACFSAAAGSSLVPHQVPSMRFSSPLFDNLPAALALLSEHLAAWPEARVLVQAHPIDRIITEALRKGTLPLPDRFILSDAENVHSLLDAADRVAIVGSTTVQFDALLYDKPVLSMSRNVTVTAGAAYGLVEHGAQAVADWKDDVDAQAQASARRGLIGCLCAERLIRQRSLPGFVENDTETLADFIASLGDGGDDMQHRLDAFAAELRQSVRGQ